MQNHRSLLAWQCAHQVVLCVFAPSFRAPHPTSYRIFDQLRRAALSVQLNLAEGYALKSPKGFRRHLAIAYGSAVETSDLLELIRELDLLPAGSIEAPTIVATRTQGLVLGLLKRYEPRA